MIFDKKFLSKILTEEEVSELLETINFIILDIEKKNGKPFYYAINIENGDELWLSVESTLESMLKELLNHQKP